MFGFRFGLIRRPLRVKERVFQQPESGFLHDVAYQKENVEQFVVNWNATFPIDRWYRKKYNIKFNSIEHRDLSLMDMYFEYMEELTISELTKVNNYVPNVGKYMKTAPQKELTLEDVQKEMEEIDFSLYDDK